MNLIIRHYSNMANKSLVILVIYFVISHLELTEAQILSLPGIFYPAGPDVRDSITPVNDDGSTPELPIATLFPYFDQNHGSLYVNTNGIVSFLVDVSQFTPDAFPLADNRRLIAPFWADVDTTENAGRAYYRETTESDIIDRATNDIHRTFVNFGNFRATWVFIATWYQVTYFGGSESTSLNTFQAVLITNGRHSFTIFNYGDINWTTGTASGGSGGLGGTPAQVGFNAGDGVRFYSVPGSRNDSIVDVEETTNIGQPGRWIFQVDTSDVEEGGCNTEGTLTMWPRFGTKLGGTEILVAGPCFSPNDDIVCQFGNIEVKGQMIDVTRARCVTPLLYTHGRINVTLSVDGGQHYSHHGLFIYIVNEPARSLDMIDGEHWGDIGVPLRFTYNSDLLNTTSVDVDFVIFTHEDVPEEDWYKVVPMARNTPNVGDLQLSDDLELVQDLTYGEYGALRVRASDSDTSLDVECLWSDIHAARWYMRMFIAELAKKNISPGNNNNNLLNDIVDQQLSNANDIAGAIESVLEDYFASLCQSWHQSESSNSPSKEGLPACPCDMTQVRRDPRFEPDPACNMGDDCSFHPGAYHCIRSISASPSGAGQQCCYNRDQGTILPFDQGGGTFDRAHWLGFTGFKVPFLHHYFQDVVPYKYCCEWSNNCQKYSEARPTDDCSEYDPPLPAIGSGDPHFVTLDGLRYTFNGVGEYTLLETTDGSFTMQGRTQQAMDSNGDPIQATTWQAFAMTSLGADRVQIEANERRMIDVYINGELQEFEDLHQQYFTGVRVDWDANNTKVLVTYDSQINVEVSAISEDLTFLIMLPTRYKRATRGLLGVWNDNPDDDLTTPSGDVIPVSSNLFDIHHDFGLKWITNANTSVFHYRDAKKHDYYQDIYFTPHFALPNLDNETTNEAINLCGDNFQCQFDFLTTGKAELAQGTLELEVRYTEVLEDLEPVITCGFLDLPTNGSLESVSFLAGATVTFSCDEGYKLQGSSQRTCQANGVWNGEDVTCQELPTAQGVPLSTSTILLLVGCMLSMVI